MTTIIVILSHDVEQERFHVVVERLRSEKQLGEQTKILAVYWVLPAINLEE